LLALSLLFALPALAGNWGENWGMMVWGSVAAVPTMGWLGGGLLVGLLASLGLRRIRRVSTGLGLLLALAYAPVADAQTVSVPNTLTNGSVAEADLMNADFTAVEDGVNTALANRATDCAGAGGTWNAGTSTCSPASSYNCFIGGFCSQAAIDFSPWPNGYVNVYEGHTQSTEPALGAGCNTELGASLWDEGWCLASRFCIPHIPPLTLWPCHVSSVLLTMRAGPVPLSRLVSI